MNNIIKNETYNQLTREQKKLLELIAEEFTQYEINKLYEGSDGTLLALLECISEEE